MGRVVIGMDPHKRSATIEVLDEAEQRCCATAPRIYLQIGYYLVYGQLVTGRGLESPAQPRIARQQPGSIRRLEGQVLVPAGAAPEVARVASRIIGGTCNP